MKRKAIYYLIGLVFCCCNNKAKPITEVEYYPNGNIKSKTFHKDDKKITTYFFENKENIVEAVIEQNRDSSSLAMYYHSDEKLKEKGTFYSDSLKVGKWEIYDENQNPIDIREYLLINGDSYLNQRWVLNKEGDTIGGNFFLLKKQDTIDFGNKNRFHFLLKQPLFSENSEAFVLLPKEGQELKKDFSNHYDIEWDTIHSIGTKYKLNEELKSRNHDVILDAFSKEKGEMSLMGVLVEKASESSDSVDFKTRNIYFDIPYFVK